MQLDVVLFGAVIFQILNYRTMVTKSCSLRSTNWKSQKCMISILWIVQLSNSCLIPSIKTVSQSMLSSPNISNMASLENHVPVGEIILKFHIVNPHNGNFYSPKMAEREILWEKRHYLLNHPQALPKVLLAAQSWDFSSLRDLHSMVHYWAPMDPISALQLLLPW